VHSRAPTRVKLLTDIGLVQVLQLAVALWMPYSETSVVKESVTVEP
jgi:hypothetical protein